jgi:hypothetical protein
MSRFVRGFVSLVAIVAAGVLSAPAAHAVQTSGSIVLVPSQQDALPAGAPFTVAVYFRNTSTKTPFLQADPLPPPFVAVPAKLTGPVSVDYACLQSCSCAAQSPADIAFLGCDLAGGAATGCAAGVPGEVLINLPAAGLLLGASDAPVLLATLKLKNNLATPLLPHFIRATTEECALQACQTALPPTGCVDCAAEGCTAVSGTTPQSQLLSCKHGCFNTFEFFPQTPGKQQSVHLNALFQQVGYDPATEPFTVTVKKGATVIYTDTEPFIPLLGAIGNGTYLLKGPGNNTTPGLVQILITRRTGVGVGGVDCTQDWFKVIVDARGAFAAAALLNPDITIEMTFGGVTHVIDGVWTTVTGAGGIKEIKFDIPDRSPC